MRVIIFLGISTLAFLIVGPVWAMASTSVGGILSSDTRWTAAGSPYVLTSDLQIAENVQLTIDPGVTVEPADPNASFPIRVWGNITAHGTQAAPITFKKTTIQGENTHAGTHSYKFDFLRCVFSDCPTLYLYYPGGSLVLRDSTVSYDAETAGGTACIIRLRPDTADSYIEGNILRNVSIWLIKDNEVQDLSSAPGAYVRNNYIFSTSRSSYWKTPRDSAIIYAPSSGSLKIDISRNTFAKPPQTGSRSIIEIPTWNVYDAGNLDATNNYWGTTDATAIGQMIFDHNDDLASRGFVDYLPVLAFPDSATPVNNAPPVGVADSHTTPQGTALAVTARGVLANDTDVDGDALTATLLSGVSHGTLFLSDDGAFAYTPAAGYVGSDSFTYRAYDGTAYSSAVTVSITVTPGMRTLLYAAGSNGTISGTSRQTVNYHDSGTAVTAVANIGYHFVSWSDGVLTAARADANVTADKLVTATFAVNALPRATVYTPIAPSTMYRGRSATIYGYVAPRHTSGTYLATLKFYLRNSHGVYVFHNSIDAKRYYYSTTRTKYSARVSLPHAGRWRVRAYHSCSKHSGSYSGYDYITVK